MNTINEAIRQTGNCSYWGDYGTWLIVMAVHRDSDALSRSNFEIAQKSLPGSVIERFNHFLVGWVDYLCVDPTNKEDVSEAEDIREQLEEYTILDESHLSELQHEEFYEFGKGELHMYDGWEEELSHQLNLSNSGVGDESAEWSIICATKEVLEKKNAIQQ